jgi:hypothetical protein
MFAKYSKKRIFEYDATVIMDVKPQTYDYVS